MCPQVQNDPSRRAEHDHGDQREERADDADHDDVEIALLAWVEPHTASSVTTAPLCGRLSSVPAPITATRCSSAGSMPCSAASLQIGRAERVERDGEAARGRAGEGGTACWSPRRATPAGRRSMPSTQSRTRSKAGSAATTAPKPTRLATLSTGSTDALAPASTLARTTGRRRQLISEQRDDGGGERDRHRPDAAHRRERRRAPARLGQERRVEARQDDERHQEIDGDHDHERQRRDRDRWRRLGGLRPMDLGRIEGCARGRALAHQRILGRGIDRRRRLLAVAFAASPRRAPRRAPATTGRSPA